jgi:transcriptional regulator with XRE-family HTH domain
MTAENQDAQAAGSDIGGKLRSRRKVRGFSLRQISEASGLSIGLISQIERGVTMPTLRSLQQICTALDMPIKWLFDLTESSDRAEGANIIRKDNRRLLRFPQSGILKELLSPDDILPLQMMRMMIEPGGRSVDNVSHPSGAKAGLVLSGELGLELDGRIFSLSRGDSFAFYANCAHSFWCVGDEQCEALWVVSPAIY